MIVDASALIAVVLEEPDSGPIYRTLISEARGSIPATVALEFLSVARAPRLNTGVQAEQLLARLSELDYEMIAWTPAHAKIAADAQLSYGKGNGRGGKLNLFDLMVYAVAKERDEPLLFTGRDFLTTDVLVHPASRTSS